MSLSIILFNMKPFVNRMSEDNGELNFTLSGVNVSIANSIRRIILSEIPCVVFRTAPYSENKVFIQTNTTRMNNELIKQRMSCIPIYITDTSMPMEQYKVMLDKQNEGDTILHVTTEDFTIIDTNTETALPQTMVKSMFPPDSLTGDYIDIVRLRPRLSETIEGEHIVLSASFAIGTAKENGSFNVVSTCGYGNTVNADMANDYLSKYVDGLKMEQLSEDTIEFKKKDWLLLNSELYSIPDSYDFTIETVGPFENKRIVLKCIHVMMDKIIKFKSAIQTEDILHTSDTSLDHGFDIQLIGEDYTLGKALEYLLFARHYDRHSPTSDKSLNFCGFKKTHPHIDESIIRLGFVAPTDKNSVIQILTETCKALEAIYVDIATFFTE